MNECWKPVLDFEGFYEVSNLGRVKRTASGPGARAGRILKRYFDTAGYLFVWLSKYGQRYPRSVHTLLMKAFYGLPPIGYEVGHKDDNKANCTLENLSYITHSENMKGVFNGEQNGYSKLTDDIVVFIRQSSLANKELACMFQVTVSAILHARTGRTWKHI